MGLREAKRDLWARSIVRIPLKSMLGALPLTPFRTVSEGEFYEVRIAPPLYGRASYVQVREFVDPAFIRC